MAFHTWLRVSAGFTSIFGAAICLMSGAETTRSTPVLVELFTAEGCSSCPPADRLLATLDKLQPVKGAQIIAMSEHVDYWNDEGWVDRFSSPQFTRRQKDYVVRLKVKEPYTPEIVVDGSQECLGNDASKVENSIKEAARTPKLSVRITPGSRPQSVMVEEERGNTAARGAEMYVAFADASAETDVQAGENHGQKLRHVAVVRSLRKLGKLGKNPEFRAEVPVDGRSGERLIAFVQEPHEGKVLGAAMYRIP